MAYETIGREETFYFWPTVEGFECETEIEVCIEAYVQDFEADSGITTWKVTRGHIDENDISLVEAEEFMEKAGHRTTGDWYRPLTKKLLQGAK